MGSERPERPKHASLRVLAGFYAGLEVPVDRARMVVGRGRGADLVVAESTMSREHPSSKTSRARTGRR